MHWNDVSVETKLQRIAEKARRDPKCRFTSLFHLMNDDLLRGCFAQLRNDAAAGIDKQTKQEYAGNLDGNIRDLVESLHHMSYIPQPVRRVYIPKPGSSKQRPLGVPAIEDKIVQSGLVRILEAIYEQDFLDVSYGFRPNRRCHDALRTLSQEVESGRVNYIVEADIKGFFDNVKHDWLMKFLSHRIADRRVLRYIVRFLKAGVMEGDVLRASEEGTPQGGVISPILANIYLHYSLDLWFERKFSRTCYGPVKLVRYADDYVACFKQEKDAIRFRHDMEARIGKFGLEVAPEKTKILEFGPMAFHNARTRNERAETFDFLGFTHYCGRTRDRKRFRMKRKTISKRFTAKLRAFKDWLKASRTLPTRDLMARVSSKLRGHFAYYGVTDNGPEIHRFAYEVRRLLFKWLNRRGKRRCMNWDKFNLLLRRFPLPKPRVTVSMF